MTRHIKLNYWSHENISWGPQKREACNMCYILYIANPALSTQSK